MLAKTGRVRCRRGREDWAALMTRWVRDGGGCMFVREVCGEWGWCWGWKYDDDVQF